MTRPLLLVGVLAALVSAAPVLAQETATPEAPAEQTEPRPQLSPELDTGQPVGEAAQAQRPEDRTYIAETNGAWELQCLRLPEGQEGTEPCQMYQLLKDQGGNSVAEISLFRIEGNGPVQAGATVVVPLETLLTEKLTIQVDAGQAKRYDFSFCTRIGCYARIGFAAADINAFKAGAVAKVTIVPALAADQKVTLDMSLSGFTASFDKVTPLASPNP